MNRITEADVVAANIAAQKRAAEVRALAAQAATTVGDVTRNTVVPAARTARTAGKQAVLGARVAGTFVAAFVRGIAGR
jgi:hypothetical protein